ncbi:hypothetical protein BK120_23360 [Paenibacillus sp. FSL A5-0031]|uniref:hypothetical protein n=1 Tax=Paenibacillus sp. FSL A5-0031 TaxID=1920420 RepID=UPI00096FB705|nr:hypothetical protein [Paenibacillus sp. FSL A5-0031]OME78680.1 hypothetical protein BK120_23360 [Paenibacillus sp. FSL A5-0031]
MGYSVDCFKRFNVAESMGDYVFEKIGYENGDYIYPSSLTKLNELFSSHGMEFDLVPSFGEKYYFDCLTKEETESIISELKEPSECLRIVE